MKRIQVLIILAITILFNSCSQKEKADLILFNGRIYTVDENNTLIEALVIRDGIVLYTGKYEDAVKKYECKENLDLKGAFVYPGFNDAHSHFYGLGHYLQTVDLTGTQSWDEVLERCVKYYAKYKPAVLTGRGWDQNDWPVKEFPDNRKMETLLPGIPVMLKRVDGHAAIASKKLLEMARLNNHSRIEGGELIMNGNELTGVLIDNAVDSIEKVIPHESKAEMVKALLAAQKICLEYGLTTVTDAGLDEEVINLIDSLQQSQDLKIRIYAMISANDANLEKYLIKEPYKTDKLNVSSFKIYCDGALGSRGAIMLQPYSDKAGHYGLFLTPPLKIKDYVKRIAESKYQLNTHCIGDSANRYVLNLYGAALGKDNDRRWRIEHAQVVNQNDFALFGLYHIIPSAQPTHATSDMYWVAERIGNERVKGAYALNELLEQNGWLPLGTDFPVESPNPFHTFFAAVARKDEKGFPEEGFQPENGLTREQILRGMTLWPAKAAFEEKKKGSLEAGKYADFIISDVDLMNDDLMKVHNAKIKATYIGGERVFN